MTLFVPLLEVLNSQHSSLLVSDLEWRRGGGGGGNASSNIAQQSEMGGKSTSLSYMLSLALNQGAINSTHERNSVSFLYDPGCCLLSLPLQLLTCLFLFLQLLVQLSFLLKGLRKILLTHRQKTRNIKVTYSTYTFLMLTIHKHLNALWHLSLVTSLHRFSIGYEGVLDFSSWFWP